MDDTAKCTNDYPIIFLCAVNSALRNKNFASQPKFLHSECSGLALIKWEFNLDISGCKLLIHKVLKHRCSLYI